MSQSLTLGPFETPLLEGVLDLDQSLLDALPIGIYVCDADGQIVRVNRKALELWGRMPGMLDPAQRFCGSFRVESLDGQHISPEQTPMARAVLHGESFDGAEAVVENPDGRRWVARVNVAPLRGKGGVPVGAINCFQDATREHEMRQAMERQQRTFDLAMVASKMGTWRYNLADNICVYDDNAQRLYGLTEPRFLHDEAGTKAKFHPDDMAQMWAQVAIALEPGGDGRYDVEYRVKQLDGSWRWLSAWGLVEFDGHGADRKAVAIAGASRDLTDVRQAEELRGLLINELNHRVKNSLATVQSIVSQTLRAATDVSSARAAIDARIGSLARAHDLLTERNWSGANLRDVVARAFEPFPASQVKVSGPAVEISPRHALALSLALHELATNAAKYGALSCRDGEVALTWETSPESLSMDWRESGGPAVTEPGRRGFGTRLLTEGLARELGGGASVDYRSDGVTCVITATL